MINMPGRLLFTPKGNLLLNTTLAVVGLVLAITIDSPRTGTVIFLAVTAFESTTFSIVFGLRTAWWRVPAARAIFWVILAYAALSSLLLLGFLRPYQFWWFGELRQLLYLGLAVAGLNLCLTLTRVLGREGIWPHR